MNRELLMRIGTATVGIPLCLGLIWFKLEGLLILATCLSGLGLFEFYVAFDTGFKKRILAIIGFPFFLFWLCFLLFWKIRPKEELLFLSIILVFSSTSIAILFSKSIENSFQKISLIVGGWCYILFPIALWVFLCIDGKNYYHPEIGIGLLFLIWTSDTLAYFGGKLFGKHKLLPSISPKKTWEGAITGFVFTQLTAFLLDKYWSVSFHPWWLAGLVIGVFCPIGDLVESQWKRSLLVKDTGSFLPGHGGILDRFDGFLLAIPIWYCVVKIWLWVI
ncbi:MAG: hypothetical protein EBS07_00330 [Sphingobacteriia bacterium]|nr:hypothetical protein [Sphingobacteriia bacterium]